MSLLTFARQGITKRAPFVAGLCLLALPAGVALVALADSSPGPYEKMEDLLDEQHEVLARLYAQGASPEVVAAALRRYELEAVPLLWELSLDERQALKDRIEARAGELWDLEWRATLEPIGEEAELARGDLRTGGAM